MFNFVIKENAKSSKEYIINAFNYMLRDITSNKLEFLYYMLEFLYYIF